MPLSEALERAGRAELDLVEVAGKATPPVCRIMDYGKYSYQQSKRARESKKRHKVIEVKQMKFRPGVDEHDYQFKVGYLRKFLEKGSRTKVTVMFRGRQMAHLDVGRAILDRIVDDLKDVAEVESRPRVERRDMIMVMAPKG